MDSRLKKIERIKHVQERLHQLAEWKLAELDRKKAELAADERSMIAALNDMDKLQGLFIDATAQRLAKLAREADRVNRARAAQDAVLTEAGLRLKRTERMSSTVRREEEERLKKHGFETLLQTLAAIDKASLP
jgi:hypothetical protein